MKESILHDLYWGKIHLWDQRRVHTQEYSALAQKVEDITSHFHNLLSSEEYVRFDEMQDLQAQIGVIDDIALFEYSFRLGALMMIDIFSCKEHD